MTRLMLSLSVIWIVLCSITFNVVCQESDTNDKEKPNENEKEQDDPKLVHLDLRDYQDFQISNGKAGNSAEKALAVFLKPFMDIDNLPPNVLTGRIPDEVKAAYGKASETDRKNCNKMQRAASQNEQKFNTAIAKASGNEKEALQAGKTGNKVLKITAQISCILMEISQGITKREDKLPLETNKLKKNIGRDVQNGKAGLEMKSF